MTKGASVTVHEGVLKPYAGADRKPARLWRDDENAALIQIVSAGRSARVASRAIGRSRSACIARALRIGQPFRSRTPSASGQFVRIAERYDTVSTGLGQPTGGPA